MASKYRETYTYRNQNGERCTVRLHGVDKQETDEKFQQFLLNQEKKAAVLTLKEFVDQVYRPSFMMHLADTTKENYESYLKLNILPFMGDMPMNQITVATIQQFYDWMATAKKRGRKENLNRKSIDRIGGFASRIFKVAMEMKAIEDTPFKTTLLRNNGARDGHHKALPDEELDRVKKLIPALSQERQRLYMGFLVYTGLRREEIMGLCWDHIHLQEGYGEVKQVVVYPANKKAVLKENPKTEASERIFFIPRPLQEMLHACESQSGFVIHGRNAEEPAPHSTMKRTYTGAFQSLGIKGKFDNHDFRATFGTQMKDSGLTSAQVADLLGHADTRMVETIYARARKQSVLKHQATIEKMNSAYACGS